MADNENRSSEDLSDEASPYRLEENRRKGIVSQSRELSGMLALLAAGVAVYTLGPSIGAQIAEFMREVFRTDLSAQADLAKQGALATLLGRALKLIASMGLPICLAGFALGALSSFAQIGSIFSTEPLTPDFSRVDPLKGIQKLFSTKKLTEAVVIIFKITIISAIGYALMKTQIFQAPAWLGTEPVALMAVYGQTGKAIFLPLIGVLIVFALIDFALNRREYMTGMKVTKQEAKEEFKEREGDPHVKARIRGIQRDAARKRMMQAVKKADVIITNPTHIAIAIVYDKDKMAAPRVVAKGADFLAQRIKKIAADAGIPLVENVPLARTLFKSVKVNQYIPRALYQAVAEVLAHVYRLRNGRF